MIRGTTPTHYFGIPISKEHIKDIRVTYRQDNRNIIDKGMDSVEIVGNKIKVALSQQETLRFTAGIKAKVKIKVLSTGGGVFSNRKSVNIDVYDSFNSEVLI